MSISGVGQVGEQGEEKVVSLSKVRVRYDTGTDSIIRAPNLSRIPDNGLHDAVRQCGV